MFLFLYYLVLDSDNCQNINNMVPLNDLLMGQTFIIETNEQPLFVNGTQVKNYFIIINFQVNIFNINLLTVNNISTY